MYSLLTLLLLYTTHNKSYQRLLNKLIKKLKKTYKFVYFFIILFFTFRWVDSVEEEEEEVGLSGVQITDKGITKEYITTRISFESQHVSCVEDFIY